MPEAPNLGALGIFLYSSDPIFLRSGFLILILSFSSLSLSLSLSLLSLFLSFSLSHLPISANLVRVGLALYHLSPTFSNVTPFTTLFLTFPLPNYPLRTFIAEYLFSARKTESDKCSYFNCLLPKARLGLTCDYRRVGHIS